MIKPYHRANLERLPYAPWRLIVLAWIARALGVLIHVHGMPLGDGRERGVSLVRKIVCDIRRRPVTNRLSWPSDEGPIGTGETPQP